jgi:hypothetical protein
VVTAHALAEPQSTPELDVEPPAPSRQTHVVAAVAGVVAMVVAGLIVRGSLVDHLKSDFRSHMVFTDIGIRTGNFPGNGLFYWVNALLAGWSPDRGLLLRSLYVVLAVATGVKVWLSVMFADWAYRRRMFGQLPVWGGVAAALCSIAMSLPVPTWRFPEHSRNYLGQVSPNVWHNSTTMFLMPLALALFWVSLEWLRSGQRRLLWIMVPLVLLNALAKPSFLFCFVVVFPVAALIRYRVSWRTFGAWVVTGLAGLSVLALYLYIYFSPEGDAAALAGTKSASGADHVVVDPFWVWHQFSENIPLSFLASYLFPIVALAVGGAAIYRRTSVRYAAALAVVGLLWFVLVREQGPRELHGNFLWQAIVANFLLFLALVSAIVPWLRENAFRWRQAVVVLAFGVHVLAGFRYIEMWYTFGSFF